MRNLACVLLLMTPLQPVSMTAAASFDCDAARTEIEITICADADLSVRDETLATAYATAIGGLSADGLEAMRLDQRAWLNYVNEVCITAATPPASDRRTECVTGLYDERIATLEASRMIGGQRFYLTTSYSTIPDPFYADEPDSLWSQAKHAFSAPRLDGSSPLASGFNAALDTHLAETGIGRVDPEAEDSATSDTDNTITVEEVRPLRITLNENSFWYGHGAAHGNYGIAHLHYLTAENRWLEAGDLFAAKGWQARLAELTAEALRAEHGDMLFDDFESSLAEGVVDPTKWSFGDYGLVLQFGPYEVAAYAYGAPTATVSWEDLEPLLADTADAVRWGS